MVTVFDALRAHVRDGAGERLRERARLVELAYHAEVRNLHTPLAIKEYVRGFDVPMDLALRVHLRQAAED